MGLIDIDDVTAFAINKAEDKLVGDKKEEKTSIGGAILRFIVSLIWFIIVGVATVFAFYATSAGELMNTLGSEDGKGVFMLGIGILLLFFIITMCIPYLRKKGTMTRFLGFGMLGDAIWLIYLFVTGG